MASARLHPVWRLVLAALVVLGITLVVAGGGVGVLLALAPRLGLAGLPVKELTQKLTHDYGLWLTTLAYPPALFVLWLFRTNVDKRSWASLGFARPRALPNFARGAITGFATLSVLFSLMYLAGVIRWNGLSSDVLTRGWGVAIGSLLLYLLAFACVGFMEEATFRGYGLHNLCEWVGWKWAVGIQAVAFALVHLGNANGDHKALLAAIGALPSLALIAVFFALSYRKTGSLWFAIGFHTFWNWSLGCIFSLPVSGIGTFRLFDIQSSGAGFLSGGKFGAEGSFFLLPLLLSMLYILSRAPDHPRALADLRGDEPQSAPVAAHIAAPLFVEEAPEPERENRYRARFGSGEGFDSGTLRELRTMQEAREDAERERLEAQQTQKRAEAAREEELQRALLASQSVVAAPAQVELPVAIAEKEAPVAVAAPPKPAPALVVSVPEAPTEAPEIATAPPAPQIAEVPLPKEPSTPQTDAPPKKARPRW